MSSPSDAEVIGRSLDEPEAFGLTYDRRRPRGPDFDLVEAARADIRWPRTSIGGEAVA
jgi:hypothetical protein